jgi:hypothetical protein
MINTRDLIERIYNLEVNKTIILSTSFVSETLEDIQICYQIRQNLANVNPRLANSINISRWYDKGLSGINITHIPIPKNNMLSNITTKMKHNSIDKWIKHQGSIQLNHCLICGAKQKGIWAVWCWLCGETKNG